MPAISASASIDDEGKLHITLSNANPNRDIPVTVFARGMKADRIVGRVLQAGAMNAHNTFEHADVVKPSVFTGAKVCEDGLEVLMPKMSVVALEVV